MAQCTARSKRSGQQCKRPASLGATTCHVHGSSTTAAKAAAKRRLEQQAAAQAVTLFAARRDIHPADALLELVHWTAGEVDYWRQQVRDLDPEDIAGNLITKVESGQEKGQPTNLQTTEAAEHIAYRMLKDASDRLAKYAAAALKAGVDERRLRLAEQQGTLVALAVRRILDALNLTPAQQQLVGEVVPRELRALGNPTQEETS
ncbi:hypothetical protein [Segeticoccus rhizosphaerae]|uniref:hypothetical protein n=1 Tax=Segeticoccus rhizosphaerae TaxID=1104777 RepID=UPI0012653D38|nr:hypothetical protein [Segeticoccus rhizosphaerae]